jgi:molecular chaperone DnaK
LSNPSERRKHPRLESAARILWSVAGTGDIQVDRLRDVSQGGALVATESPAKAGDELRFDLLDDDGEKFASGIAKVSWSDTARGMGIAFLALGIDAVLVAQLASPAGRKRPPPIPGVVGGPPPMPGDYAASASPPPKPARLSEPAGSDDGQTVPAPPPDDDIAPQVEPLAVKRTGVIIGIDLGTTNTCAAYVVDKRPKIIPGRTGTSTIPSMITFDPDGTFHVGQRALDRHVLYPLRTVYGSKRLVGRTFRPELAAELQKHFAYPLGEAEGQRFGARIDDRVVSMDTIAARVLEEVRSTAEEHLGEKVEGAVITVPAYFTEVQRDAVRRAAREANLVVHRIVNEPTAAAVAYGHKEGQRRARVAVWDFGGGTFDFSIVDVTDGQLEVLATGGDNFVGGQDFDDLLASHVLGEFQRKEKVDFDPDPQQIARLREAAEVGKRALSVQTECVVEIPELTRDPKRHVRVEVTRDRFEAMARPLIDRTLAIANEVMGSIALSPKDIDDVLLVGGTTRIPAVQAAVEKLFERRPSKRINPDEAVAHGAALLADEIGSADAATLLDILPMSVGQGVHGLRFEPIVARYSRLPSQREVRLKADLLGAVTLHLFQGESPDVSKNEYLCTASVEDASLRDGGRIILRLSFDEHCVMSVDARDARTGRALAVTLDREKSVESILRELGKYSGPEVTAWKLPESKIGKVLGKLFKMFGR